MKKFKQLSKGQQHRIRVNMRTAFGAAGYDVVTGPDRMLRARRGVEFGGEDKALPSWNRLNMLALARHGMRNGDSFRALMRQMELNVVGTVGGKATFSFPAEKRDEAKRMREAFGRWAADAEFSDGLPFSKVLSLIVDTKFVGGDMVLLFDDGIVEDSGRLLAFEPDEIADLPKEWFKSAFPEDWNQRQGRIYNYNGRFKGVCVSHRYRGRDVFPHDENGVFVLTKEDGVEVQDWVMLREVWRFNQGRGVSPLAAPLDSLLDLESVTKYEVQAAMKNCQTLAQIFSTKSSTANADDERDTLDEELQRQAEAAGEKPVEEGEEEGGVEELQLDHIDGSGMIYDLLPDDYKMELLDTKRPNPNVEGFVKWLSGRSGAAVGLAKCYATLEAAASYTAFRGEQVMSWPTFEEWQKNLERDVCDWVVRKWAKWASRKGIIDESKLPAGWARMIKWSWPTMREVDMKANAEAKKTLVENGMMLIEEVRPGEDPDEFVEKLAADAKRLEAAGFVHPFLKNKITGAIDGAASMSENNKEAHKEGEDNNG